MKSIWNSSSGGYISYLQLWQASCLARQNHLYHFGRGYYEDYFFIIILNLDQWLREVVVNT